MAESALLAMLDDAQPCLFTNDTQYHTEEGLLDVQGFNNPFNTTTPTFV